MRIAVAGMGYVGLANAVLLARKNEVRALDINDVRVAHINRRVSYLADPGIERSFKDDELDLVATTDPSEAYAGATYVIVATPTDYDDVLGSYDTSDVTSVIDQAHSIAPEAVIVVKSTVPVGFTAAQRKRLGYDKILFAPEFLRAAHALEDILHPARVVVGGPEEALWEMNAFCNLMARAADQERTIRYLMGSGEAEAVRLFANAYLAMRVAFFNELDTYAVEGGLDTFDIIEGVSSDPRVGDIYNSPSFGYGGSQLPKDTLQLSNSYQIVPGVLVDAVVRSNSVRKRFMAREILERNPHRVGVYRLTLKRDAGTCKDAAVLDIIKQLVSHGVEVEIYEPNTELETYLGCPISSDLEAFKRRCDLIICNRWRDELEDVREKVYTRDRRAPHED